MSSANRYLSGPMNLYTSSLGGTSVHRDIYRDTTRDIVYKSRYFERGTIVHFGATLAVRILTIILFCPKYGPDETDSSTIFILPTHRTYLSVANSDVSGTSATCAFSVMLPANVCVQFFV